MECKPTRGDLFADTAKLLVTEKSFVWGLELSGMIERLKGVYSVFLNPLLHF